MIPPQLVAFGVSLFTNPKNLLWLGLAVVVGYVAFTMWSQKRTITELKQNTAVMEQNIENYKKQVDSAKESIDQIQIKITEVESLKSAIRLQHEASLRSYAELRNMLDGLDIGEAAKRNPQAVVEAFQKFYLNELNCIEYVSGKEGASCPELQQ